MKIEIGENITVNNGTGIVLESSIQGCSDECVNLYLVDFGDHMDVVAQDNASNWVVGDENDMGMNYDMVETIGASRLKDFVDAVVKTHDEELRGWLLERIVDANKYENMNVWYSCDDCGNIGAHDVTRANAIASCEHYQEIEPENGWEVHHN